MSLGISAVDTIVILFRGLNSQERKEVLKQLENDLNLSPCVRSGHNFKPVRATDYLFSFLNKTKLTCTQCGESKWV